MDLISINEDTCVFCGLCSSACPFSALDLSIDNVSVKEIESYPHWDVKCEISDDDCIYCGRCNDVCPRDSIIFKRDLPDRSALVREK